MPEWLGYVLVFVPGPLVLFGLIVLILNVSGAVYLPLSELRERSFERRMRAQGRTYDAERDRWVTSGSG